MVCLISHQKHSTSFACPEKCQLSLGVCGVPQHAVCLYSPTHVPTVPIGIVPAASEVDVCSDVHCTVNLLPMGSICQLLCHRSRSWNNHSSVSCGWLLKANIWWSTASQFDKAVQTKVRYNVVYRVDILSLVTLWVSLYSKICHQSVIRGWMGYNWQYLQEVPTQDCWWGKWWAVWIKGLYKAWLDVQNSLLYMSHLQKQP